VLKTVKEKMKEIIAPVNQPMEAVKAQVKELKIRVLKILKIQVQQLLMEMNSNDQE